MSFSASHPGQPVGFRLSKSRIAAFEHCSRRLWLQVHRPELAQFDDSTLAVFARGHEVGAIARSRYLRGILVGEDHREIVAAMARTSKLIAAGDHIPIFEAAFQRCGVVVRADILEPDGWGGWRLIEVKSSSGVRPYQLLDLATQAWVLSGSGICISSMIIRHLARPLRGLSPGPWIRFVDEDLTRDVLKLVPARPAVVQCARDVLAGGEPPVAPGPHCERPFRCEFRAHCGFRRKSASLRLGSTSAVDSE